VSRKPKWERIEERLKQRETARENKLVFLIDLNRFPLLALRVSVFTEVYILLFFWTLLLGAIGDPAAQQVAETSANAAIRHHCFHHFIHHYSFHSEEDTCCWCTASRYCIQSNKRATP
jgi:hypothetical protein